MRPWKRSILVATLTVSGLFPVARTWVSTVRGDEPGRLGRLFRLGTSPTPTTDPTDDLPVAAPVPIPPASSAARPAQPRLLPQPRVSHALTEADPLVTRVSLGRSDDGTQFGMFLMVYADGTVIDSEGVHQVGRDAIKDVSAALARTDFFRIKGHCGGPSTDFVEQVQMVVYERSLGRLRASSFSFSGNPQGCDHAVQHLQTTLDALQARMSRPPSGSVSAPVSTERGDRPAAAPIRLNDVAPR